MQGWHALIVEGDLPTDEDVEDDSETPDVDFGTGVETSVEEFGGGEVERTAEGGKLGVRGEEVGETEVDDLDVSRVGDEDVLDLEV